MRFHHTIAAGIILAAGSASPMVAGLAIAQAPAETAKPLSSVERRGVVTELAALLRARYVDPALGERYATAVERAEAAGAYDSLVDAGALASKLTEDLRAVSPDKHLRVTAGPMPARGRGSRTPRTVPDVEARWAAPGIAFLAINASPGDPAVAAEAERLLLGFTGARALIIDLRQNSGGTGTIMNAILPYLYGQATPLVAMDTRAAVEADLGEPDEGPSARGVASPAGVVRRVHVAIPHRTQSEFFRTPVYVLTSAKTASVAEHMTLALKRTKRATVVGETTSGAGNYGSFNQLGQRFVAFVPFGRTFDPDTGRGWEGTGVPPDVVVPADRALDTALELARSAPAPATRAVSLR